MARAMPGIADLTRAVANLTGLIDESGHLSRYVTLDMIELRVNRTLELLGGKFESEKDRIGNE